MTKYLNGRELAEFIKVRQAEQVRSLKQRQKINPKLCIFINANDSVIDTYVRLKQAYGKDIGVNVEINKILGTEQKLLEEIKKANNDSAVHGIIIQLPIDNPQHTDKIVAAVDPKKDVDGLSTKSEFDSATAVAINWLLSGYNVELKDKEIAIIGAGRLVGSPLYKMWINSNFNTTLYDETSKDMAVELKTKDIIVSGVGKPGLITNDMVREGAILVDAGTAAEGKAIKGDVSPEVYEREDITITPVKGGVGPLTVAALFDHVIKVASLQKL